MKSSGIPISSLPLHVQQMVRAAENRTIGPGALPAVDGKRLRQSSKGPNKTEAAFASHIRACYPGAVIHEQAVTLVLANGLRYTPDIFFPAPPSATGKPAFYEVKGYMRDDAAAKIKMAARVHVWADFLLVTKPGRASAGWIVQTILP